MISVEILIVGNEILLGLVEDTNSTYLCRVIRGMAGRVRHVAVVRDDAGAIADEIKASIKRGADLIITAGGLGPTDDDLTLAGVSQATGLKLELNAEARQFVERRYLELAQQGYVAGPEMNDARSKMARIPEGSRPVDNPVGAAPAVILKIDEARIVALPGVPAELRSIVEGPLQNLLGKLFAKGAYREREITINCGDESALAPALRQVASAHPDVYIKSRASHFGRDVRFRLLLSASAASADQAEQMIEAAAADLIRELGDIAIE